MEYDPYESSWEEAEADLLNNPNFYDRNCQSVQKYYETPSQEDLVNATIDSIIGTQNELNNLIDFKRRLTTRE